MVLVMVLPGGEIWGNRQDYGRFFAGQDLHLLASRMTIYQSGEGAEPILVFEGGFSLMIGANELFSDSAVVWLETLRSDYLGNVRFDYRAQVYLEGNVSMKQGVGALTTDLRQVVVEQGQALVARFLVSGEVFATAESKVDAEVSELAYLNIYQNAIAALEPVRPEPQIAKEAAVVKIEAEPAEVEKEKKAPEEKPEVKEVQFEYPITINALWEPGPQFEKSTMADGTDVTTVIGRFYLWQKQDEKGSALEFQADSAVIFHSKGQFNAGKETGHENVMPGGSVEAIYLSGNIIMTEGSRTIRAEEVYYDFANHQSLAVRAEMRNFDAKRGIPVYLRAQQLRQVSENVFNGDNIILTTSEFYFPQVSLNASRMVLTDTTSIDERTGKKVEDSSYDGIFYDVKMKLKDTTVFYWPKLRTNLERPDVPIRKIRVGRDSEFGTSVETRWYLYRLLGLKKPSGVDGTFAFDHFGKRGTGTGVDIDYKMKDYLGNVIGYVIRDRGTDDLGRTSDRKDLEPDQDLRGRFRFRHRHYLPYDWQATIEVSYATDENFLEWFYRSEFDIGKAQETLLHLKRLKDNWAFSFLSKFRITKHRQITEELPTIEFHLKGASFFDHKLTYYSDSRISRLRDRYPAKRVSGLPQQFYAFASTRHEVDMPLMWKTVKLVPFVAGTYGFEDQRGYFKDIEGTTVTPEEDAVWLSEIGIRLSTMFWKENQLIRSRLWDLNGLRHIVKPHLEAVLYQDSDKTAQMRNLINIGLTQRWQTHRKRKSRLESIDWMRLNLDATWVDKTLAPSVGPTRFFWNDPAIPIAMRRSNHKFGILRDSINADYVWNLSDTTTVLSDMNYDVRSGIVQQFNVGLSRYVHPDLRYYIGSRYLRAVVIDVPEPDNIHEEGSNSVVVAATYALNSRYTAIISQEYNFDFGENVESEITILRQYHRMYYGLTFSVDEARDRSSVVLSIWPQGVEELAMGERKYFGLSGLPRED